MLIVCWVSMEAASVIWCWKSSVHAGTADKDALVRAKATQHLSEAFPALLKSGHQLQPVFENLAAR